VRDVRVVRVVRETMARDGVKPRRASRSAGEQERSRSEEGVNSAPLSENKGATRRLGLAGGRDITDATRDTRLIAPVEPRSPGRGIEDQGWRVPCGTRNLHNTRQGLFLPVCP
jgi:hypothetical protein